jgi:hypothetical protein
MPKNSLLFTKSVFSKFARVKKMWVLPMVQIWGNS